MKQTFYIFTFFVLTSCGEPNSEETTLNVSDTATKNSNPKIPQDFAEGDSNEEYNRKQFLSGFENETLYKLTDTINADFNGDSIEDRAFYKKENKTSGIIIKYGQTNKEVRICFGKPLANLKDLNWVDYWALVKDKETGETTFSENGDILGSKEVKLQNPSIFVGRDEEGGGLITFRNGKYEWIHKAD